MLLATLAGCGGGSGDDGSGAAATGSAAAAAAAQAEAARTPALCGARPRVRVTGRVTAPAATELSGLVVSTGRRDVLWSLNDSGNPASLLALHDRRAQRRRRPQ